MPDYVPQQADWARINPADAGVDVLAGAAVEEGPGPQGHLHVAPVQAPEAEHTAITNRYSGRPARSIVTRLMRELGPLGEVPPFPLAGGALAPLRSAAEAEGKGDFSPLWSGQNNAGCKAIGAAQLTRELVALL